MNWTLGFQDPLAVQPEYTGGKGANLARLTSGGFDVPGGFVVVAAAYREWLAMAAGQGGDLPWENRDLPASAAGELRDWLGSVPLPGCLVSEVRERVAAFPAGTSFAVRSSSTMEDMAEAAFAGQHESFLNCPGAEEVIQSIRKCYLSLWEDRAIAYRQQAGFDHRDAEMAVVVQEMALCDKAGVAFSMNPVTGDLDAAVINANYGLGESVVSGTCEIDHWEVSKSTGAVLSARVARKTVCTVASGSGGTEEQVIEEEAGKDAVLAGEDITAIKDLLRRVESLFRFPQDIEWGFVGDRLVILQSRPVTRIPPRWTRQESAERFPNAMTPLTWDFINRGFHLSMEYSFRLMGFPRFSGQWFGKHDHYIYGNQNAVDLYLGQFPFHFESLEDLPVLIPHLRKRFQWVQELPANWSRDLDYYLIRLGEFMGQPVEDRSITNLWELVKEINDHGTQYFRPNIAISVTQGILYKLLLFLLHELFGAPKAAALMDGLLAFCETKTSAVNRELFELAAMARRDPLLEERLRSEGGSRALWESGILPLEHGEFHDRFLLMMRNHGHRELDIDLYHPLWAEVPWVALDQVRLILDAPADLTPAQRERELKIQSQESEFSLYRKLPREWHFFVHEIVRLARIYTSLDDIEHYQTTRLTVPLRKALLELGKRLVERGVLSDASDIFFVREAEIESAVAADDPKEWAELAETVRREKVSWEEANSRSPAWIPDAPTPPEGNSVAGLQMKGIPGSPGSAEGQVYVVNSPADFAGFPAGAILVARTTNPVWTPLFYSAGAVITESGGPLSHGAVTAREVGIPAVMSVRHCLATLDNGRLVRVDGTTGLVTVLDATEPVPGSEPSRASREDLMAREP